MKILLFQVSVGAGMRGNEAIGTGKNLQLVLNVKVHLLSNIGCSRLVTSVFCSLHQLLLEYRVQVKVSVPALKDLNGIGIAPSPQTWLLMPVLFHRSNGAVNQEDKTALPKQLTITLPILMTKITTRQANKNKLIRAHKQYNIFPTI